MSPKMYRIPLEEAERIGAEILNVIRELYTRAEVAGSGEDWVRICEKGASSAEALSPSSLFALLGEKQLVALPVTLFWPGGSLGLILRASFEVRRALAAEL